MLPIDAQRRANLERLLADRFAGNQAAFARAIEVDKNQLSQWLGKGSARNISTTSSRKIERVLDLPAGWLDHAQTMTVGEEQSPYLASHAVGLDVGKLADLLETVEAAIAQSRRQVPARTKARMVAALYADERASAAGSAEAVQAVLASILATMEDA